MKKVILGLMCTVLFCVTAIGSTAVNVKADEYRIPIGYESYVYFSNATHHPIYLRDIPSSVAFYNERMMVGSAVYFADVPTTITFREDREIWGSGNYDWFTTSSILQQIILPENTTLMEYLKPSYEDWDSGAWFETRSERIGIPFDNMQYETCEYGHITILAGSSTTISTEGIFIVRANLISDVVRILVVGNAGDSVLATYNQDMLEENLATASTWSHYGIRQAIELGLVPEARPYVTPNLKINFHHNINRAEFAVLGVALYETATGEVITGWRRFSDTQNSHVMRMGYLGVLTAVGDNNVDPGGQLTREQAAVMLVRLADAIGQPLPQSAPTFADNAQISDWAFDAVGQVQAAGIMSGVGDNQFAPNGYYTREQSIVTMLRLFEFLN